MYKIYFDIISSEEIENLCSPENSYKEFGEIYINLLNNKIKFYELLEKSILKEGFRNPILVNSPKPRIFKKISSNKIYYCEILGGSRLMIAQKYNLKIPVIICDFSNEEKNMELLITEDQIKNKFKDKPEKIYFTNYGIKLKKSKNDYFSKFDEEILNLKLFFYKNYLNKRKK